MEYKSMPKEEIIKIGDGIYERSDIVAVHGTSIASAKSIMASGLNFHRTTYRLAREKNTPKLCAYGWKECLPGDSANVIISIPKSFLMRFLNMDEIKYTDWLDGVYESGEVNTVIESFSSVEVEKEDISSGENKMFNFFVAPTMSATIPKEFIEGMFVYTDGFNYLSFDDVEKALEHLTYIPNDHFFERLSVQEQETFIRAMSSKILGTSEFKKDI